MFLPFRNQGSSSSKIRLLSCLIIRAGLNGYIDQGLSPSPSQSLN